MMHLAHRVETALISDANKVIAIKDEALLDSLLAGLLVDEDNPRRGAEGCEELQEVCAGILSQLALFGPGAAALKSHGAACKTLKRLCTVVRQRWMRDHHRAARQLRPRPALTATPISDSCR